MSFSVYSVEKEFSHIRLNKKWINHSRSTNSAKIGWETEVKEIYEIKINPNAKNAYE